MNAEYLKLVSETREFYKSKSEPDNDKEIKLSWCDKDETDNLCQEINLWTYWQGWHYAEKSPKINVLLLGQDWGNPYGAQDTGVIENIRSMNDGIDVPYLHNCNMKKSGAATDRNLVELFNEASDYKDIDKVRYDDLFFSNFCLGYRQGKSSQGMTQTIMQRDNEHVKALIDILKPEKILCLGEGVTRATICLLFGKAALKYNKYGDFLEKHPIFTYHGEEYTSKIYPLAHPGYFGRRNRGVAKQIEDWKGIFS